MSIIDELINELNQISPMPEDIKLTKDLMIKYHALLMEFYTLKDPKCILPLISSFGYGEANGLYWSALHLLETFEVEQVDPLLMYCIKNGERGTKMWAAYMLGRSRNVSAVDDLILLLDDNNELVRRNSAMALGMIGDKKAISYLKSIKNDISKEVRSVVDMALKSLA